MKWVTMWGNAQSTVVPHPFTYAKNLTLRYPIFIPFNGNKIQITLDNFHTDENVTIENVTIGIGKKLKDEIISDIIDVTFNNKTNITIKAHETIKSDIIDINLNEDEFLIISLYLKDFTKLTQGVDIIGPLSKGYFYYGNGTKDKVLDIYKTKSTSWVYFLSNIDIFTDNNNEALITFGDSITSQDWPDYMLLSLREKGIKNMSVIRKAISGTRILREYNCILYQSYGLKGKNRFIREIESVQGANNIIIQHGINDIIHPVGEEINIFRPMSDLPSSSDLIDGLNYYINEANKRKITPYLGTLLPIYNWRTYAQFRENIKNEVNTYIRNTDCIDFEKEIGIFCDNEYRFKDLCDSGDHLHPSKHAYKLMGELAANFIINKMFK